MKFSVVAWCMFKESHYEWNQVRPSVSVAWSYSKQMSSSSNPVPLLLHWLQCGGMYFEFNMFYTFLKHIHIVHSQPLFFSLYLSCTPANWIFFCDMMESMRELAEGGRVFWECGDAVPQIGIILGKEPFISMKDITKSKLHIWLRRTNEGTVVPLKMSFKTSQHGGVCDRRTDGAKRGSLYSYSRRYSWNITKHTKLNE